MTDPTILAEVEKAINAIDDEHYDSANLKYCREGSCQVCAIITRINAAMVPTAHSAVRA